MTECTFNALVVLVSVLYQMTQRASFTLQQIFTKGLGKSTSILCKRKAQSECGEEI